MYIGGAIVFCFGGHRVCTTYEFSKVHVSPLYTDNLNLYCVIGEIISNFQFVKKIMLMNVEPTS